MTLRRLPSRHHSRSSSSNCGDRLCGRAQDIEDVLASTSSVWLAVKCLQERRWVRDNDPDLCPRLRRVLTKSPCGG
jgi:hypothetical protein